jgi:hypothetical protein
VTTKPSDLRRRRRPFRSLVLGSLALAPAILLSACGSSGQVDGIRAAAKVVVPTTTAVSARDAAIIAGWRAAYAATTASSRTMDWQSPALPATHAQPELGIVVRNIWLEHSAGYIGVGHDTFEWTKVVSSTATRATVDVCVNGHDIAEYASTHKPAPGFLGEVAVVEFVGTMIKTSSGWKLSDQKILDKCQRR